MRFKIVFFLLLATLSWSRSIDLVERNHGHVRVSYAFAKEGEPQSVTLTWVDSNPAYPSQKIAWYPTEWHVRYRAPLYGSSITWTYKEYRTYPVIVVVQFPQGVTTYPFRLKINEPNPVEACAEGDCYGEQETK